MKNMGSPHVISLEAGGTQKELAARILQVQISRLDSDTEKEDYSACSLMISSNRLCLHPGTREAVS